MANGRKTKGGDNRRPATKAADAERAARALELARKGMPFAAIAVELGYKGKQGAHNAVNRALGTITKAPAERYLRHELRRIELEFMRLDAILEGLTRKAAISADDVELRGGAFDGSVASAEAALKVSATRLKWAEHRARILGLLKPPTVDVAAGALIINVTPEVAAAFSAPPEHPQLPPASVQ